MTKAQRKLKTHATVISASKLVNYNYVEILQSTESQNIMKA